MTGLPAAEACAGRAQQAPGRVCVLVGEIPQRKAGNMDVVLCGAKPRLRRTCGSDLTRATTGVGRMWLSPAGAGCRCESSARRRERRFRLDPRATFSGAACYCRPHRSASLRPAIGSAHGLPQTKGITPEYRELRFIRPAQRRLRQPAGRRRAPPSIPSAASVAPKTLFIVTSPSQPMLRRLVATLTADRKRPSPPWAVTRNS